MRSRPESESETCQADVVDALNVTTWAHERDGGGGGRGGMSTGNAPFQLETVINVTYEQNRLAHRCIRESVKHAALGEKAAGGAELEPEAVLVHRGDLANCSVCKRVSRNRLVETSP